MFIWAIVEAGLIFLIVRFKVFNKKELVWRQLIIEILFFILFILLGVLQSNSSSKNTLTLVILALSIVILVVDFGFIVYEYAKQIVELVKSKFSKKKITPKFTSSPSLLMLSS